MARQRRGLARVDNMHKWFWLGVLLSVYSYFLYPLILLLIARLRGRATTVRDGGADWPALTLVITAHNEAQRIGKKIENTLLVDYPRERLQVIVASDCSMDATEDIVRSYADRGIELVSVRERLGKENAQLAAIEAATGEILVFSDVATEIPPDALQKLALYFADDNVGAVSSEDRFVGADGVIAGEGLYVRYEMALRRLESQLAGLVGLSGSFFAVRKDVVKDLWDIRVPSDFNTAINCARRGKVAVTAPDVLGYYADLADPAREYQRKLRTVLRGITGLVYHAGVLNPFKYGLFAFQVFSHKLMRWLVPWALVLVLVSSLVIAGTGWFYGLVLLAQIAFYGTALAAHWFEPLRSNPLVRLIYFFVQVNLSIAHATVQFIGGKRMQVWQPSVRG